MMRLALPTAAALALALLASHAPAQRAALDKPALENPAIDMGAFLNLAEAAARHRSSRRIDEAGFIALAAEPGTIVLDARSREMFDLLHIEGAINLSFPDITVESLARLIPDKSTRILIYCNNNFEGEPRAFPTKLAPASLNLSTYVALYTYGYRNVYELGPLLDARATRLPLVSSR